MIPGLGCIVEQRRLGLARRGDGDEFLERLVRQIGPGDERVGFIDVSFVVLAVMKLESPRADMRLERIERVRKLW